MTTTRRQASMYLSNVTAIEALRLRYNPAQSRLIPAHVTLCREDEVLDWGDLQSKIDDILPIKVTIGFGNPVRDGNLVLLPAVSGIEQYDELRNQLLGRGEEKPRTQLPHVTLIHPRNGLCTDTIFEAIANELRPFEFTFEHISLIEQIDGGPWSTLS